jgi:hypothetical protein
MMLLTSVRLFKHRVIRFGSLTAAQKGTLAKCALLLPVIWVRLRMQGLAQVQARLNAARVIGEGAMSVGEVKALAELVNAAARVHPFPATCLTRSLMLVWLLHRRGIRSELRLGARIAEGKLDGHAWVEYAGVPVNDDPQVAGSFSTFSRPAP